MKFKWENDELLVDNGDTSTSLSIGGRPALNINLELAKKMGWIWYRVRYTF